MRHGGQHCGEGSSGRADDEVVPEVPLLRLGEQRGIRGSEASIGDSVPWPITPTSTLCGTDKSFSIAADNITLSEPESVPFLKAMVRELREENAKLHKEIEYLRASYKKTCA
jgi:hypothetical protein